MAGLTLVNMQRRAREHITDADLEEECGRHVVWSDISSEGKGSSASRHLSGSEASSGHEKRKKLKNKGLTRQDVLHLESRSAPDSGSGSEPLCLSSERPGGRESPHLGPSKNAGYSNRNHVLYETSSGTEQLQKSPYGSFRSMVQTSSDSDPGKDNAVQEDSDGGPEQGQQTQVVAKGTMSSEMLKELEATVRKDEKGNPTSVGSANHDTSCKACLFVFTTVGCDSGVACSFCHFKHKRGSRPRPCKGKRNRYRKLVEQIEQQNEPQTPNEGPEAPSGGASGSEPQPQPQGSDA